MLREVLDVARTCLARRRRGENGNAGLVDGRGCESGSGGKSTSRGSDGRIMADTTSFVSGSSTAASTTGASLTGMGTGMNIDLQQQPGYAGAPTLSIENMASSSSQNDASEEDFFFSFFSQDPHQPPDRTRTEMLANLVDPSILEDFAFGGQELSFF